MVSTQIGKCSVLRYTDDSALLKLEMDLYPARMLSAGFEPTPRETYFDSVMVTTWLSDQLDGLPRKIRKDVVVGRF